MQISAAVFNGLSAQDFSHYSSVRELYVGTDVVSPARAREMLKILPDCKLIHTYGPTETTVYCISQEFSDFQSNSYVLPIGAPLANARAYVLDSTLTPVPIGCVGELYIAGAGLALSLIHI